MVCALRDQVTNQVRRAGSPLQDALPDHISYKPTNSANRAGLISIKIGGRRLVRKTAHFSSALVLLAAVSLGLDLSRIVSVEQLSPLTILYSSC